MNPMIPAIKKPTWITFGFCLAAGVGIFIETAAYPAAQGGSIIQGSAFYPRLLAGLMVFLGALLVGRDISTGAGALADVPKDTSDGRDDRPSIRPVVLLLGLSVVQVLLIRYLGFIGAGILFLFFAAPVVGPVKGSWKQDLGFSLGVMALIFVIFELFVGLDLPKPMIG